MEIFRDKTGRQICSGDLLKSYHFTGARKKRYWLYHVAVELDGYMEMIPVSHLDPRKAATQGGKCRMCKNMAFNAEIIDGSGPDDIIHYEDRPKMLNGINGKEFINEWIGK